MTLSRVFHETSLPQLSIRSKISTAAHPVYSSLLSPICPETLKDTSRPSHCGQRIEADFFEPEFNDISALDDTSEPPFSSIQRSKLKKLKSFGGALAGYVYTDVFTDHVDGKLLNSMAKPLPLVKATVRAFKVKKHKVEVFSADQGVISQSLFRIAFPAVQ